MPVSKHTAPYFFMLSLIWCLLPYNSPQNDTSSLHDALPRSDVFCWLQLLGLVLFWRSSKNWSLPCQLSQVAPVIMLVPSTVPFIFHPLDFPSIVGSWFGVWVDYPVCWVSHYERTLCVGLEIHSQVGKMGLCQVRGWIFKCFCPRWDSQLPLLWT